ncbi:MAG: OmpA family protein, partial [Bacteroidetes bacterium]|nr:OmpA family protein [Bacteroidota bacterium]
GNNDGSNRNGNNDGSNRNGNNDGSNRNGNNDGNNRNGNGDSDGTRNFSHNFRLKSIDNMMNQRDKWGDLLAQRVNTIFFDFNKWDLKPESFFELDRLVRFLASNPQIRIVIAAHTDDVGNDEYNFDLSRKRALSVVNHLVQKGVDPSRLESVGYGETRPEVPNDSDENRARNRRVEFRIAE